MKRITNIITINTSYSKSKAVDILKKGGYDCLFLDFGRNQESFIRSIAEGADPHAAVALMKDLGLVKEPEETQAYRAAQPLFECLPSLDVRAPRIYCYKEDATLVLSRDIAVQILLLTVKARVGKIKAEEWKEVLKEDLFHEQEAAEVEASYIAERAGTRNICMGASEVLVSSLAGSGFHVTELVLDQPCKPLDMLAEKLKRELLLGECVPDEEVERLVKEHVRFVDLILELGYDEAYKTWSRMVLNSRARKEA